MQIGAVFGRDRRMSDALTSEGKADHFVNQLLTLISLEKLSKSCQPGTGGVPLPIVSGIHADRTFYYATMHQKAPDLSYIISKRPQMKSGMIAAGGTELWLVHRSA